MEVEEDAEAEKEDLKVREARKKVYCTLYSVTFVHTVRTNVLIILEYVSISVKTAIFTQQRHPCYSETITCFVIDLPLCQTILKIDLTFMVTLTIRQTYTAQSFMLPPYYLTIPHYCQTNLLFGLANIQ